MIFPGACVPIGIELKYEVSYAGVYSVIISYAEIHAFPPFSMAKVVASLFIAKFPSPRTHIERLFHVHCSEQVIRVFSFLM